MRIEEYILLKKTKTKKAPQRQRPFKESKRRKENVIMDIHYRIRSDFLVVGKQPTVEDNHTFEFDFNRWLLLEHVVLKLPAVFVQV